VLSELNQVNLIGVPSIQEVMTAHRELRMCWESIWCAGVCDSIIYYV